MPPKIQGNVAKMNSLVQPVDSSGAVFRGFYIWTSRAPAAVADADLMFAKCLVLPGSTADVLKCRQVEPDDPREFTISQSEAFNCNANIDPLTYGDIGMIPHKNAPCVLDFLKQRYMKGQIYTTADPLLVAINPFQDLGNTTDTVIAYYRDAPDPSKLPPHVFSIARTALENLHAVGKSQTIIVSGESGAGKTEATKQIMRYLAAAKTGTIDTKIQEAVLAANPVLEAFGNAKTVRNNNSSRFGRFMQLQVAPGGGIEHGYVQNFLLEKSRIITQEPEERSYHIFYQFLKGATPEQRTRYALKPFQDYKLLNPHCLDAPGIDDVEEWHEVIRSLRSMRRTEAEMDTIFSIISGILLLGNVAIDGGDSARVSPDSIETFRTACGLLYLDADAVQEGICVKISSAGGDVVRGRWNEKDAEVLKQSLGKAMYDRLFDWIVRRLNTNIEPKNGFTVFMGMLDIFGFEVFANNSLEQFFINITNEMLQKNFIDIVFERETRLYREEGISAADLVWTSNNAIIALLTAKTRSVMAVLEDQCVAPGGADEKFVSAAYMALKGNQFLPGKVHPNVNFIVVHTIGPVQYNATGFLAKNKDILRAELVEVVQKSCNPITRDMFENVVVQRGKLAKGQLTGSQFLNQLTALMSLIQSTEPHFIRCVKPNEEKRPLMFTHSKVLIQLCALSVLEALELRNLGYSYRRPFVEFIRQFRFIDLGIANKKSDDDARANAVELLRKAKIAQGDYQIGRTMVFLKSQAMKALTQRQRECMALWDPLVTILEAMALKKLNEESVQAAIPGLRRFQANVRRLLAS